MCSKCGHTEKANRVSQAEFVCKNCDLHISSDFNAAKNIRGRAVVNHAQVSEHLKASLLVITGTRAPIYNRFGLVGIIYS